MKFHPGFFVIAATVLTASVFSQTAATTTSADKRVVVTDSLRSVVTIKSAAPTATPTASPTRPAVAMPSPRPAFPVSTATNLNYNGMTFAQMKARIAEAKRYMSTRPLTIATVTPTTPDGIKQSTTVRVAFYDNRTRKIDYVVISKDDFLRRDMIPTTAVSSDGTLVSTRTIRANGVNTPVTVTDMQGTQHIPLLVQYPVERNGRYIEMAYYMSTHPGLVTPEVVAAGQFYVRNTIDVARDNLRAKGHVIQPKVVDWAERLATVEHVDHQRFRTEPHANIYNDIFTLYALNEGQTYRYSVSSAGAGGMVQMIPATYRMIRSRFPNVNLIPDFVTGMQNHVNASQAMLLYMQMTWNDLTASPTVQNALATGIAREEHLMAAGYNSNPARLPGYINRGGAAWATLIPRETKIYLQIWDSLERTVPMQKRTR